MEKKNIFGLVALVLVIGGIALFYSFRENSSDNPQTINNQISFFESSDIIATVNKEEILGSDFEVVYSQIINQQGIDPTVLDEQTQNQLRTQVVDTIIAQILLKQQAEQSDIIIPVDSIDSEIELIKEQFGSEEVLEQALSVQGLTEEDLRDQINEGIIIDSYLDQELNLSTLIATEAEVNQVYEQVVISSNGEAPPLADIYEQLELMAVQQKIQTLVTDLVDNLRADAEIEILI